LREDGRRRNSRSGVLEASEAKRQDGLALLFDHRQNNKVTILQFIPTGLDDWAHRQHNPNSIKWLLGPEPNRHSHGSEPGWDKSWQGPQRAGNVCVCHAWLKMQGRRAARQQTEGSGHDVKLGRCLGLLELAKLGKGSSAVELQHGPRCI